MKKREQVLVIQVALKELEIVNEEVVAVITPQHLIKTSENELFRQKQFMKELAVKDNKTGVDKIVHLFKGVIVDFSDGYKSEKKNTAIATIALKKGVKLLFDDLAQKVVGITQMHVKRALRSASQFLGGRGLFAEASLVEVIRQFASYNTLASFYGRELSPAKVEAYISLPLSTSLSAGGGYTSISVPDFSTVIAKEEVVVFDTERVVLRKLRNHDIKVTGTDGGGVITPPAAIATAKRLGIISAGEARRLRKVYLEGGLKALLQEKVWCKKVPSAFQVRYGWQKGLLVVAEHDFRDEKGRKFDLVFGDGATKGLVKKTEYVLKGGKIEKVTREDGVEDVSLSVVNVAKPKLRKWQTLTYQYITNMVMHWDELKALTDEAFEFVVSATKSPQDAMAVLGMAFANEEDEEVRTTSQKLVRLLAASPAAFNNRWVQNKLSDLLRKKIENFKVGKVPVRDGKYVFITGDPVVLIGGAPLLKPGEAFYIGENGVETGERVLLRSPNNHKSEVAMINLVDSPELREAYGHVKNVLILNVLDDTLLRLGGADVDGDKVFMSAHPILIGVAKRVQDEPLVHGDYGAPEANKTAFSDEAVLEYDLRTVAPAPVGIVTYYTVAYADMAQCDETNDDLRMRYWNRAALGRIIQGRVIDDAKKGTQTEIPAVLEHSNLPHWLVGKEPGVYDNMTVYRSTSAMGRLYDYVEEVLLPRLNEPRGDKSIALLDKITYSPFISAKLSEVTGELSSAYRRDVARLMQEKDALSEEVYNERFKVLVAKHQTTLAFFVKDYDASDVVASIILVDATYEAQSDKPSSYLYVVAIDYLVMALRKRGDALRLAPILNERQIVEDGTPVRVYEGVVFFNDEEGNVDSIGRAPKWVADGQYTVVFANDRNYILVPRTFEELEEMAQVEPVASLEIKGFKANGFESAEELAEAMKGHQVLLRKKKSVKTGDEIIAVYTLNKEEVGVLAGQYSLLFKPFVGEKGVVADVRDAVALRGVVSATLFFHLEERTMEEETPALSEEAQEAVESVTSVIDLADFDEDDAFDLSVIL